MKTRQQRQQEVDFLANEFRQSANVFLVSFEGLSVDQDWDLRRKLRQAEGVMTYRVVKNRLAQKAAQGTPLEPLSDQFKGMTAVAINPDEPISLAKVLTEFGKQHAALRLKGGIVEGRPVAAEEIAAIAKLPSKPEVLSQIMGMINLQTQNLVSVVNGVMRELVVVLGQIRDRKAETAGGDS